MDKVKNNIIGVGWGFPPAFDLQTKQVQMVTGEEDIMQSLKVLFGTRPGERVLAQTYGCDIEIAMFQNMSLSEKTLLENTIRRAITNFEVRILINTLDVDISQIINGIVHIQIDFTIKNTNSRHNIVYPYFIGEGTLVPKEI